MKRACPFQPLPQPVHPSIRTVPEHVSSKRKQQFEQPVAKRFCTHECLKRKCEVEDGIMKRRRFEEEESRTNMLVDAYRRIDHLEQIIRQLGIELEYYRHKTSNSQYINGVLAY